MSKSLSNACLRSAGLLVAGLICASSAYAQNAAPVSREAETVAREKAVMEKARPLIEAERLRPRIGGFWAPPAMVEVLKTADGQRPPLNSAGAALYKKRQAENKAGRTSDLVELCLPPGTPRSTWAPGPILIAQTPAKVTIYHQYRHLVRHVFLDGPLKVSAERDPYWQGHSSGYWQGDTLIIETGDFNGLQWLDKSGLPQSEDMRVTERLKLVGNDTLESTITIEDPKYYSKAWTTKAMFKRLPDDTILIEDECSEKMLEFPLTEYAPPRG
jgi:hypothetical protein